MTRGPVCDAPRCVDEPCAHVRLGPVPAECLDQLVGLVDRTDRSVRLDLCPAHVTPFVDVATVRVADVDVPVTLAWVP